MFNYLPSVNGGRYNKLFFGFDVSRRKCDGKTYIKNLKGNNNNEDEHY